MEEPSNELREWAEENDADLDVGDDPNVPEDGDWLFHIEDGSMMMTMTHFTEGDGATVLYGTLLEKEADGAQYDLMLQEEPMIQGIPKLGDALRFRPQPDAMEVAVGRDDEGTLRAKIVGQ